MDGMAELNTMIERLGPLWWRAVELWRSGGWAMVAIAVTALIIFGLGMHVFVTLQGKGFRSVPERTWRRWIRRPRERRGPIGELLSFVAGATTPADTASAFEELRKTESAPIERDLRVMKICISAAPLLGLFGTVTGMLDTFSALASGSGGEKTMNLVAEGISEALITTETGLVVALPGLFLQYQLTQKHERYKAFLAHLETVCAQETHRSTGARAGLGTTAGGDVSSVSPPARDPSGPVRDRAQPAANT